MSFYILKHLSARRRVAAAATGHFKYFFASAVSESIMIDVHFRPFFPQERRPSSAVSYPEFLPPGVCAEASARVGSNAIFIAFDTTHVVVNRAKKKTKRNYRVYRENKLRAKNRKWSVRAPVFSVGVLRGIRERTVRGQTNEYRM